MSNLILVGCQWGDEGKGRVTDLLGERVRVVVRFQGGPNAGHTLVVDDEPVVLHLVPSGALRPGVTCVIGNGVVVDPEQLAAELALLAERGLDVGPARLWISDRAPVILPLHRERDAHVERERGAERIGTTGRGIGPAYEDKVARVAIRAGELGDPALVRSRAAAMLQRGRGPGVVDAAELDGVVARAGAWAARLAPHVRDTVAELAACIERGEGILFEGAQGTMLDVDHGSYPFVTSSNTVAGAACCGAGVGPTAIDAVLGVAKAYTTRVGEGPFPTELLEGRPGGEVAVHLATRGGERGATTGRPRRCGWFDAAVVRRAAQLNGLTGLVLTKLDVLSGLDTLRLATGYRLDGEPVAGYPAAAAALDRCESVYEELPGWTDDLTAARRVDELPPAARAYVDRVEQLVGVPVRLISVGPRRDQIIVRSDPFDTTPLHS